MRGSSEHKRMTANGQLPIRESAFLTAEWRDLLMLKYEVGTPRAVAPPKVEQLKSD